MLSVLIHDSDRAYASHLRETVKAHFLARRIPASIETHFTATAARAAVERNPHRFDILLVNASDVDTAVGIARSIRPVNLIASLLFFAADASALGRLIPFRISAFFRNPIRHDLLLTRLDAAIAETRCAPAFLVLSNRSGTWRFPIDQIESIRSEAHSVHLHVTGYDADVAFTSRLDDIERRLPQGRFLRCHQSFLVNTAHVATVDRRMRTLRMLSGNVIPVSRRNGGEVLDQCVSLMESDV